MQSGNSRLGEIYAWFWSGFFCAKTNSGNPIKLDQNPTGQDFTYYGYSRNLDSETITKQRASENGSVDALLFIIPIIFLMIILISLFQYGLTLNTLNSSAVLIGRDIAREPEMSRTTARVQSLIEEHNLGVVDFHIMNVPIGDRVFIQLVLIGKTFKVGGLSITPSARSLTLHDSW